MMFTKWERVPLCPLTWIGGFPNGQSPKVIFSVDVANPPEDTVTLVGVNEVVMPPLSVSDKETVPVKPPVLVTSIVTRCRLPATICLPRSEGVAVIVKSAVARAGKSDGKATTRPSKIRLVNNLAVLIFMFDLHLVAS